MNILITGGTGLIGSELVKKLTAEDHEVRILTRKQSDKMNFYFWDIKNKKIEEKAFEN